MLRSGIAFTEEEINRIGWIERQVHGDGNHEVNYKWWRELFDENKREKLSLQDGLDDKIQNGITRYGGTVSAEGVRDDCTHIMYAQTKAQIFNIIEAQFDAGTRQDGIKRSIENVLSAVSDNIDAYLRRSLIEGLKIAK